MKKPAKPWQPTEEQFRRYMEREVQLAESNLRDGATLRDTLHSRRVLCAAVQSIRDAAVPSWGSMPRDPRRFSSTPRRASAAQVKRFVEKKAGAK